MHTFRDARLAVAHAHHAAPAEAHATEQNHLLRALPADEYALLLQHLESVELSAKLVLWRPEAPIHSVYFPRTAVMSLLTPLANQPAVEAATVGREGIVGTPVVLGVRTTGVQTVVQIAGTAGRMDADRFTDLLHAPNGALFPLLLRHAQALYEQTAQSVACNRRHEVDERCARWLLMTHDRVGADEFNLTHQFLALMLGVRRAGVTVALGTLQRAGLISNGRGTISVIDREGLEAASCECYDSVRRRYALLLGDRLTLAGAASRSGCEPVQATVRESTVPTM
jgi:CRP-like cAMP-binding protein